MNAANVMASVMTKVVVCGVAALSLTVASSWTFVESTATATFATDMPTVVIVAKAEAAGMQLAKVASTGLLQ
jgi:hypothetical protein